MKKFAEYGCVISLFQKIVMNKSLNNIKVMYESRYSNDNLLKMSLSQKKVRKNKAVTPDSSPYKQLSFGLENENQ